MSAYLIDAVLALFWAGFVGLNLWLWRAGKPDDAMGMRSGIRGAEGEW